jgi:hypothetical protein
MSDEKLMTSSDFYSIVSSLVNQETIDVDKVLSIVEQFQKDRDIKLNKDESVKNDIFPQYFTKRLEQVMEKQTERELKIPEELLSQKYSISTLIALSSYIKEKQLDSFKDRLEKVFNSEKKRSHKTNTILNEYIVSGQEMMYDYVKLLHKERSIPSIEDRLKEIRKTQKDNRKFEELSHPKLTSSEFEKEIKMFLIGEHVNSSHIENALKIVSQFETDYLDLMEKRVTNPTIATEKMMDFVKDDEKKKALLDWVWNDKSPEFIMKSLLMIKSKAKQLNINDFESKIQELQEVGQTIKDIMGEISTFEKEPEYFINQINSIKKPSEAKKMKIG